MSARESGREGEKEMKTVQPPVRTHPAQIYNRASEARSARSAALLSEAKTKPRCGAGKSVVTVSGTRVGQSKRSCSPTVSLVSEDREREHQSVLKEHTSKALR